MFGSIQIIVITVFTAFVLFVVGQDSDGNLSYRLPNNTIPETYDITLQTWINEANFTFTGIVRIGIIIANSPTKTISLHYRQLTILNVVLYDNSTIVPIESYTYIANRELLVISTTSDLEANRRFSLVISYIGTIREDNGGFYRSSWVDENGVRK